MDTNLNSDSVHHEINALLLNGKAETAFEAESMFLDHHLIDLARLALELDEETFKQHEAVKILLAHGSRPFEDSLE